MSIKEEYEKLVNSNPLKRIPATLYESKKPVQSNPKPTKQDYKTGWMNRYFLKRIVPVSYKPFEVDKSQYDSWNTRNSGIDSSIYEGLKMKWRLTGSVNKKFNRRGYPVRIGVKEANKTLTENAENNMSGIQFLLTDPLQYFDENRG